MSQGATLLAQVNIVKVEYYIDHDPGFGLAIDVPIVPGTEVDHNFIAITDTLSEGYHTLYVRAKNENGLWGILEKRTIYVLDPVTVAVPSPPDITELEYFINNDPGLGMGIKIDVADNITAEINNLAITDTLSSGYHTLGFRARTNNGNWGWTEYRNFYVATDASVTPLVPKNIVAAEYYFDDDPGQGQATSLGSFGPGLTVNLDELVPTSLGEGYHTFNVRSKDEDGIWGFVERRPIYVAGNGTVTAVTDITKVEYFFDGNDPGPGNAIDFPVTPGQQEIEFNTVDIPTSPTLVDGQHTISFRAKNGNGWGIVEIDTFDVLDDCLQPIAAFDPQLACAGSAVVFNNTSTNLQGDASYRWYLDGDAIIDETTQNASFTYPFPGTYVVALAVRQGSICLDSLATTIEIQPQPVAVFSTAGGVLNQPTTFTASASNLPASPTWAWDFDGDLIIDDNTAGSTSFTYSSEGTFNPSLTITDSLGCFVTVTNPITISVGGGGGAANPSVNFLASNGCVGNSVTFIDLSQNLPAGSTYSWDFDGDGIEDASNAGNTTFSYTSANSYTASLTIDIGGSTISASQVLDIVDIPVLDFSADDVFEGSVMTFTDLSTPGTGSNVYMWDFNNDGVVDSNASTDITYTYSSAGTYIVALRVSNGYGCENEVVKQVNVVGRPTPGFDWNQVCAGVPVLFDNLSQGTIPGAVYSWDLDGDATEDANDVGSVEFTFPSDGTYNASLNIVNLPGCDATITKPIAVYNIPDVAIDINARCYGQESQMIDLSQNVHANANYYWDFGEAGGAIDETKGSTTHTYTSYNSYLVTLTIDNGENCRASTEALVEFADAATPNFETNKLCEGEEVIFTDYSIANQSAIYSWDFDGDGTEDSAFPGSTGYTYQAAGTYNAMLTIDNGGNCLANKIIPLVVTPPPAVDLGPDEILCEAGEVVLDAGTGYNAYLWPDGSTDQTYTIDQIGEYVVRIQDALQCYNTDTIAVKLLGNPEAAFEYSFDLTYQGIKVQFENLSSNADTYEWEYAGAVFSEEEHSSMIITDWDVFDVAVYEICLTAYNDCNETRICENVYVSPTQFLEPSGESMSAYPSPTSGLVQINLADESRVNQVLLMNTGGEVVWYKDVSTTQFELDLSRFDRGAYYIIGKQPDKLIYQKIVKL